MGVKQVSLKSGIVSLDDIPSGRVYVKLNEKKFLRILNFLKKSNTLIPVDLKSQLYRISIGNKNSLDFLNYFSLNFDYSMSELESYVDLITSAKFTNVGIKKPKFPFDFTTKDGIRFISAIMGDGELNKQLNVRYNNQDKKLIDLVLSSAEHIFGQVDYKIYLRDDDTYQLHFPKIIGLVVLLLGVKPGYKSKTNYGIPEFIFELDKSKQAVFIRQFFNDEGNVRLKDRRLQVKQTTLSRCSKKQAKSDPLKHAHRALVDVQKLLLNLGIDSKISMGHYRGDKIDWELSIYRIENLKLFRRFIGFDLDYKNRLLDEAIKSYKFPSAARNGRLDYAISCVRKVQQKYGYVTKTLLAKESKRSLKVATYYLVDLKKKKLVKCIEKPVIEGRMQEHKYIVVKKKIK